MFLAEFLSKFAVGLALSFALVTQVSPAVVGPVHVHPNVSTPALKPQRTSISCLRAISSSRSIGRRR